MSHEIVTRQEALSQSLKFYFTGKPCKHGHVSRRHTGNSTCRECSLNRSAAWQRENPEKVAASHAKWRRKNPEKVAASSAKWARKNPEKMAALVAKWQRANPEKMAASRAKWRRENPAKIAAKNARYRAAKLQRTVAWADETAIAKIYANAADLTEATGVPFAGDHIYPLQGELVSGLHCEANLWAIPARLNSSKGNKMP